jgi:inorganic pyrophosphatase
MCTQLPNRSLTPCLTADGKPENTFAFSGEAKNKKYATEIIHECHEAWRRLAVTGESPAKTANYDLSVLNVTVENSIGLTSPNDPVYANLPRATRDPPKPIDPSSTSTNSVR